MYLPCVHLGCTPFGHILAIVYHHKKIQGTEYISPWRQREKDTATAEVSRSCSLLCLANLSSAIGMFNNYTCTRFH